MNVQRVGAFVLEKRVDLGRDVTAMAECGGGEETLCIVGSQRE